MTLRSVPLLALALGVAATLATYRPAEAYPAFATKEKKTCNYCHLLPAGGEGWGFRGTYYDKYKSFKKFVEAKEAKKAGVKPGAVGPAAKAKKPYRP